MGGLTEQRPRKNLVVVRAGDRSLHQRWFDGAEDRSWDLHISYFGSRLNPFPEDESRATISYVKGTKFVGLKQEIYSNPHWIKNYDYICLSDDDIDATATQWNDYFINVFKADVAISQPSIDCRSFYHHDIVIRRSGYLYRYVNFIELMMPTFRSDVIVSYLDLFDANKSSIGLDYIWSRRCEAAGERMAIIDAVGLVHTRALGSGTQYAGFSSRQDLIDDTNYALKLYKVEPYRPISYSAVAINGSKKVNRYIINMPSLMARINRKLKKILCIETILIRRNL